MNKRLIYGAYAQPGQSLKAVVNTKFNLSLDSEI